MAFSQAIGQAKSYYRVMNAEKDLAEGRWLTGSVLMSGMGLERDMKGAVEWFNVAATAHDAFGLLAMSMAYEHGWGVRMNKKTAFVYLKRSLATWAQGLERDKKPTQARYYWDALKHVMTGLKYCNSDPKALDKFGSGSLSNHFRAVGVGGLDGLCYLAVGSEAGYFTIKGLSGINALVSLLEKSASLKFWHSVTTDMPFKSTSKDKVKKFHGWVKRAMREKYAQAYFAYAYYEENQALVMEHFKKGSSLGCTLCSTQVFSSAPECKESGPMAAKSGAFAGLVRGANQGSPECMALVGRYLVSGTLVKKDRAQAYNWAMRSTLYESPAAYCFAGDCLVAGWGCEPKKFGEALALYKKAAGLGFSLGVDRMAQCFQYGHGVKQDLAKARSLYLQLPEEAGALLSLAFFYRYGLGGPPNHMEALRCLTAAAMQGSDLAVIQLGDGEDHVKDRPSLPDHLAKTQGKV